MTQLADGIAVPHRTAGMSPMGTGKSPSDDVGLGSWALAEEAVEYSPGECANNQPTPNLGLRMGCGDTVVLDLPGLSCFWNVQNP